MLELVRSLTPPQAISWGFLAGVAVALLVAWLWFRVR
jgi:hypothetical protein